MYQFDEVINRRHTNSAKWDRNHTDDEKLISMWVADMDFRTCPDITEAISKLVNTGIYGYNIVPEDYYSSVMNWMKNRHSVTILKDWIIPMPGVVNALHMAIEAYTKINDHILIMKPVYYPFDSAISKQNRMITPFSLTYKDHTYTCDFDKLEETMIKQQVKMMILCNPHNPVGKVWSKEELIQIGDLCEKHNIILFSDEIHMDFVYKPHNHISFYNLKESYKDFTIIATSASKTFNLAGLETSSIFIANKTLRHQYKKIVSSHANPQPSLIGLQATITAYTKGEQWLEELLIYLQGNIQFMKDYISKHIPELKVIEPEGLYLVWVDFRKLGLNKDELEDFMLNKAHLWLDEGYIFGEEGIGFERFNIACPRSILEKALIQLDEAIQNLKNK